MVATIVQTDPLFYRLFQERPETAFDLRGIPAPVECRYAMHAEELKQTAQRIDGVLRPDCTDENAPLVFTEAQFYADNDFYRRWLSSIFLYLHRHQIERPWWGIVVYPDRATETASTVPFSGLFASGLLHRVYLDDLIDAEDVLSLGVQLARLIVLERVRAASEARQLLQVAHNRPPLERARLLDLIETVILYKFTELTREEIAAMLHLPETDMKRTRFYQQAFGEGRQEGRHDEVLGLVQRLLRRRFAPLDRTVEHHIGTLTTEQLEDLAEAMLDFNTAEEVVAWLRRYAEKLP